MSPVVLASFSISLSVTADIAGAAAMVKIALPTSTDIRVRFIKSISSN
jgi:hypothetical protein